MDIKHITDTVSVTGQICPNDIETIVGLGFRSIICNRPDGEEAGQATFETVAKAADAAGLPINYVPISHMGLTAENVGAFQEALANLPTPILAYCRSGARSAMCYSMAAE
ncbi:TIGR01244 family sulfur transferase [Cochlodiniinecator piscidefendens]|uniref:TIGR01244 family sulfur transferase n=1 Tax=Cochlodiniinecator piscidefendens TaxID=2715756 RepID=UPI00140D7FF1|nr:TIGR01244 family sulfur transferase [Cochlodiniinecator piscidefendens]